MNKKITFNKNICIICLHFQNIQKKVWLAQLLALTATLGAVLLLWGQSVAQVARMQEMAAQLLDEEEEEEEHETLMMVSFRSTLI